MDNYVITIARGFGSGGKEIGTKLGERLGIPCYENQILDMASEQSGIGKHLFAEVDEKIKGKRIARLLKINPIEKLAKPSEKAFTSDNNLYNIQCEIIKELAKTESCIIIGRCADYVLKDDPNVLRLFFFAPKEDCIVRVMEHDGITGRDAENKIEKIDKHRADYYKYYTGKDWYDARNYDFCLDTTSMGYEKLVEVVKNFIEVYQS